MRTCGDSLKTGDLYKVPNIFRVEFNFLYNMFIYLINDESV